MPSAATAPCRIGRQLVGITTTLAGAAAAAAVAADAAADGGGDGLRVKRDAGAKP